MRLIRQLIRQFSTLNITSFVVAFWIADYYNVSMAERFRAIRRTKDQLSRDRLRITELLLQTEPRKNIIAIIKSENGYELSPQQLSTDIRHIRDSWLVKSDLNYDALINMEIARVDTLEAELWRQMRNSSDPTVREIVDEYIRSGSPDDEDGIERVIQKVSTMTQTNPVNVAYFGQIQKVQIERRKLLGVYAPARLGISVTQEVIIKGYDSISPDDWPEPPLKLNPNSPKLVEAEIIEGEIVDASD